MPVKVTCRCGCGKEFEVSPSRILHGGGKYYSKKCRDKALSIQNKGKPWKGRSPAVKCTCLWCGNEFLAYPNRIAKGGGKYCKDECKFAAQRNQIAAICQECGKIFPINPAEIKRGNGKYCGRECTTEARKQIKGEMHPLWRGGKIKVTCQCGCGREFEVFPSQISRSGGKFYSHECSEKFHRGENCPGWKGGTTSLRKRIRASSKYHNWIHSVFERDDYCDYFTGISGGDLEAHHVIPFATLLKEYNIKTYEDAMNCTALWDINNGVTMSKINHKEYHGISKKTSEKKKVAECTSLEPAHSAAC